MYVYPNKYFHLNKNNLGKCVTLIPSNFYKPNGVSFAPSIKQALNALPIFYTGTDNFIAKRLPRVYWEREYKFYIFTPIKRYKAIIPTTADDVKVSQERRVICPVESRLIGKITVVCDESQKGRNIHNMRITKLILWGNRQ